MNIAAIPQDRGRAEGFSLVELLVVLAIVAGVLALAARRFDGKGGNPSAYAAAFELAGHLRATRAHAIGKNRLQVFDIDADNRTYQSSQSVRPIPVPKSVVLTFATARENQKGASAARILFYPNGGSTGGVIGLSQGGRTVSVTTDWLTGAVTIERQNQ